MSLSQKKIDLHIAVIKSAVEDNSPFKGMVDFSDLLKMPLEDQKTLWNAMGKDLQKKFTNMYMNKNKQ
jgi:hypothetical protein